MRTAALLLVLASSLAAQTPEKLFQERKFDEARTAAKAQLATNKSDANATYWMGRIAFAENKSDEAIEWLEKAVKLDNKNATYHYWLGNSLGNAAQSASKVRQPFLARRMKSETERAIHLDPTLIDARESLVNFYSMAPGFMGGSNDKAREQVAEITKLNPMRGHLSGARLAERLKDAAGAEREFKAAIAVAPDSLAALQHFPLASFYRRQSRWDDAFATYELIMKMKPDEIVAHLGWGATAAQSGKSYERGEREIKQFLATATIEKQGIGNLSGAQYRLGTIYEKTSRRDLAKAAYAEAVKVNPQNADAKKALDNLK